MLELLAYVLEHVPGRHVGPLHLVEKEHQGAPLPDRPDVLRHLVEQAVLAAPPRAGWRRFSSERGNEVVKLTPRSGRSTRQPMECRDQGRPHSVRLTDAMLTRASGDERTAAQADLRLELADERRRTRSGLA